MIAKDFPQRAHRSCPKPTFAPWLLAILLLVAPRLANAQQCTGDCNDTVSVEVNELVTGVNISLGAAPIWTCSQFDANADGSVGVDELVAGVGNSVFGCAATAAGTSKSGPIAVSPNGRTVVAVNTDTNSITIFDVLEDGTLRKKKELGVGVEPRSVALTPDGRHAYVANTVSGTVSVISLVNCTTLAEVQVETEPWAVASSPNGRFVYVANANSNSVSVVDTRTNVIFARIAVSRSPRALAVTNDGDAEDNDEMIYVPSFYARARVGFVPPGTDNLGGAVGAAAAFPMGANGQQIVGEGIFDDSREGVIDVISTAAYTLVGQVILAPLANTGFNFPRNAFVNTPDMQDAPRTIFADGGTDGTQPQQTGAFPNALLSVALFDGRGFVPSTAPSPEPPLRFNINVQSLVSVFNLANNQELTDQTFNLNRGINFDLPPGLLDAQIRDNTDRMFPSAPVDIACSDATGVCWVVSQGSDFIVRMSFDGQDRPTINAPTAVGPFEVSPVTRIYTIDTSDPTRSGRNPRGIALSADGTRGYVVCPTTRDVIVADLENYVVLQRVRSSELPAFGVEETIRRGKVDFFTSRPPWSDRGWGGCWSCHPDGRTDTVTWSFEAGPRQTISLDGTFNHRDPEDQRLLNWSPVRDENQDFELNTRGIFGGRGFITVNTDLNSDGITPDSDPNVRNFGPASSGRAQQQEDITAFIQLGIRAPISPPNTTGDPMRGRDIFGSATGANCVVCHSGGKWTTSRVTYDQGDVNPLPGTDTGIVNVPPADLDDDGTIDTSESKAVSVYINTFNSMLGAGRVCEVPPPPPGVDVGGTQAAERIRIVHQVGTFTASNPIELRSNAQSPVNTMPPMLMVNAAFGGDGFNTPTLLGVFDSAPYFHNGAFATLAQLFGIGTPPALLPLARAHWRAGTGGAENVLDSDPTAATDLVAFVRTIDERTPPFAAADIAPDDPMFADHAALCDCQKDPLPANTISCLP